MASDSEIWMFSDCAYLHPHRGRWGPRRPAWGGKGIETPPPAQATLAAFEQRSSPFNNGRAMPVLLDDADALGPGMAHTSRVRWVADGEVAARKALVVYLRGEPRSAPYAICHEVAHNLLYAEGLTRLQSPRHAPRETVSLISQVSTSTSHPLAIRRLEDFDYHVFSHEAARAERFLRLLHAEASGLRRDEVALIAAEFSVALGHFWLSAALPLLRRLGPGVDLRAQELSPLLEKCVLGVKAAEQARRQVLDILLYGVEVRAENPLRKVPGPRVCGRAEAVT